MEGNSAENEQGSAAPEKVTASEEGEETENKDDNTEEVKEEAQTNGKRQLDDEEDEEDKAESPPVKRSKTSDNDEETESVEKEKSETIDKKETDNMATDQTEEVSQESKEDNECEKTEDNKVDQTEDKTTEKSEVKTEEKDELNKVKEEKLEESPMEEDSNDDKIDSKVEVKDEVKDKCEVKDEVKEEKIDEKQGISEDNKVVMNGIDTEDENLNEPMDLGVKSKEEEKVNGGSVHSEDSEKENVDVPMDLSRKSTTPVKDVIMLSDEEEANEARLNGEKEYNLDDLKLKRKMIKRLQAELRNEEAKLVLLKKLRFSQMSQQVTDNVARKTPQPNQHSSQPPPLVRGNQQMSQQAKPAHSQPPQLQRPNGNVVNNKPQGPPPLVMAPRVDQQQLIRNQMKLLQQQQQQQLSSNKPQQNNLPGFRGTQAQADAIRQMQQVQQRVVEETPAQRQAAAKLALRKQLEKTLLQIPPPKPPPPEMNFIPSLASPDFIYLLGLEEAVNFIIDTNLISKGRKNPDEKMVCNPFTCVQCGTDFTPVWKREKPGSKNVICEQCVTSNQKKALKQEHTNRLKSAFVKALQQEQEIERMQSQEMKSAPVPAAPKEKTESRTERDSRESSARSAAAQACKESMDTLRQHQYLVQAHQAAALRMGQPLGLQGFNPRAPFPYQLPFAARASDLQRQYLLDMIPKGGLPWNS